MPPANSKGDPLEPITLPGGPVSLAGYRFAVLRVRVTGCASSASFLVNQLDFRRDSGQQIWGTERVEVASNGSVTICMGKQAQQIVPITAGRTFDYQKTDTINSSSVGAIELMGYC